MRLLITTAVTAAAIAFGAAAATRAPDEPAAAEKPTERQGRQCFFARSANSFAPGEDDRTVYVRAGVRDVYQLELFGYCPNIDWTHRIGIRPRGAGSSICRGFDADLLVPSISGRGWDRCGVRNVRKLTEDEVAALPPRSRP